MRIELPITPIGKPRQTQSDKWKKRPCVLRYRAFCDELRARMHGRALPEGGLHLTFFIPMPKSWSMKKQMAYEGQPHQQKPDVDNLTKAVLDALLEDDSGVWDVRATKRWAYETPRIVIEQIEPTPNGDNHE